MVLNIWHRLVSGGCPATEVLPERGVRTHTFEPWAMPQRARSRGAARWPGERRWRVPWSTATRVVRS